jgi:hypothetical protein
MALSELIEGECEKNLQINAMSNEKTVIDDYLSISEYYNGRSIFITGGNYNLLLNLKKQTIS